MSRLGHFVKDMGGAVQNVAKVGEFAANPTNIPKIASGVGKVGEFVAEHPGQTAHIAKEVGIHMAKEQLKPQNLLITAGLVAATALTAGAAAPALAGAEAGMVGAEGGLAAAEGVSAGVEGAKAVEAGAQGAKAVEAATEAGQAARSTEEAANVGRAAEDAVQSGSKLQRGMDKINEVRRTVNPVSQRIHEFRTGLGEKALSVGLEEGETAGPVRQAAANLIQGTGGYGPTTRMEGQSEAFYRAQQQVRGVKAARQGLSVAKSVPGAVHAAADPEGYAMQKAMGKLGSQKMGDTGSYEMDASGKTIVTDNANGMDVSNNGVVQPPGMGERMALRGAQKLQNFGAGVTASNSLGGPNAFWKGPGREAFGGIHPGYDWRKLEQRPVNQVTRSDAFTEAGMGRFPDLQQPGASAAKPTSSPPPTAPSKMATSAMYSGQAETTPGARVIMPAAGSNDRGAQEGRSSTFYGSGTLSGEDTGFTMTGTKGWNADTKDSMTFEPLSQPKSSGRKGGIGNYGLERVNESLADTSPVESPLVPKKPQPVGA